MCISIDICMSMCMCYAPRPALSPRTEYSCDDDETKPTMLGDVGSAMSTTVSESELRLATKACEPLTVTL